MGKSGGGMNNGGMGGNALNGNGMGGGGRVVSRSGVEVKSGGIHPSGGIRAREVSGKVMEEGRGNGGWMWMWALTQDLTKLGKRTIASAE